MGITYRLNEYRQQIKFYKDLYKHYYNSKFDNIYNKPYDDSQQIPKIINYAWFGKGEYPDLLKQCMKTWPKVLRDYEFKLWNEDNFPIEEYPFAKQAYDRKNMRLLQTLQGYIAFIIMAVFIWILIVRY